MRFLAPLFALSFLLPACVPAEDEVNVPSLPDDTECLGGVFSLSVLISGEGDGYNLSFSNGEPASIHAPAGQIEVVWDEGDPVAFSMTTLDGAPLPFEEVSTIVDVFPVIETDGGMFQTGSSLEPVKDDPPWVAWNCP